MFIKRDVNNRLTRKIWSIKARYPNWRYYFAHLLFPLTENEEKLKKMYNIHAGQRCFIIGNGPSLNLLDLTKLKNEITFGVNAIFLNYKNMHFYPTYYVVEDTFFAEDRIEEINRYKHGIKFFGNYLKYCLSVDENTILINIIVDYREYKSFPHFSTNALRNIYVGGSVTYLCMQLAFYMGFNRVYLIGFDHNYSIPNDAILSNNNIDILSYSEDINHFSSDYFGKGKRWHNPRVDRMEKAYIKAKNVFESYGRKIYNATKGGNLEVFERVDYESLFI